MARWSITHTSCFRYAAPITETVMEVRCEPRDDENQDLIRFQLATLPRSRSRRHGDAWGNRLHAFDVPQRHGRLVVVAKSIVEVYQPSPLPERSPLPDPWYVLDTAAREDELCFQMRLPSQFVQPTPLLRELACEVQATERGDDPVVQAVAIMNGLHQAITYTPQRTRVDSPIDDALGDRAGVCQDFTHILLALLRPMGIPARYVSGYLAPGSGSDPTAAVATHAWVEAFLPGVGWVGLDATGNTVATDRHIRVAIGRDYADLPPTRGIYRGNADEHLDVTVAITDAHDDLPVRLRLDPGDWPDDVLAEAERQERDTPSLTQQVQLQHQQQQRHSQQRQQQQQLGQ